MTPLEERLQQALSARADQITHETVSPARPPAPARRGHGRVAVTTAVLAAAATAAVVGSVTFTSLGRTGSPAPAGTGGPTVAVGTTSTPAPSTPGPIDRPVASGPATDGSQPETHREAPELTSVTMVLMRPSKLAAGTTATFKGACPNPGMEGTVASEAFLRDDDHDLKGKGAQTFLIDRKGTFAGTVAVEPGVKPGTYPVSLWCGSTDQQASDETKLIVLETQAPGTDQDIRLAAHQVYAGEWVAFSGVCKGGEATNAGWVLSAAFEASPGHEYAGVGAASFKADDIGLFVGTAHVAEDQEPGSYEVTVRCSGGVLAKRETLEIVAR